MIQKAKWLFLLSYLWMALCCGKQLPKDLMYEGKPISNVCMQAIARCCLYGNAPEEINLSEYLDPFHEGEEDGIFSWSYVGTLPQGYHLIYVYEWQREAWGKFSGIFTFCRVGDKLQFIDGIVGGDRYSTMIREGAGKLEGNVLTFARNMDQVCFYCDITDLFPELLEENIIFTGLKGGEAGYFGMAIYQVNISENGKFETPHTFISFELADFGLFEENGWQLKEFEEKMEQTKPSSLSFAEALEFVAERYEYIGMSSLNPFQLKEMMKEVFSYTQDIFLN